MNPQTPTSQAKLWPFSPAWHAVLLSLVMFSTPAWPHGGEDHGDEGATAMPDQQAPRASARTDTFELVAVLNPGDAKHPPELTIYLDKVDTNEPVSQASIEVESGAFKASAKAMAPGVYSVPAAALTKPGRHPLTFTVQDSDNADLLDATLVNDPHEGPIAQAHPAPRRGRGIGLAAAALALIAAAWLARRHRRQANSPAHHAD